MLFLLVLPAASFLVPLGRGWAPSGGHKRKLWAEIEKALLEVEFPSVWVPWQAVDGWGSLSFLLTHLQTCPWTWRKCWLGQMCDPAPAQPLNSSLMVLFHDISFQLHWGRCPCCFFLLMKLIPERIKELGIFNSNELLSLISTLKLNQGKASSCLWTLIAHSRRSQSWVLLPALGFPLALQGEISPVFHEQRHKVLLLWGESGVSDFASGCSSLAGSCVLLVSHVLPALAARGEKLISGHWFWLHLQGNFIHRQLPSGHAWVTNSSSCYIPEELLTPSAQVGNPAGNGHRAGGCHKHPANLTCSVLVSFPLCFFFSTERAKSSSLFKILLGAERSQPKFVSPGIIMLHYALVWVEHCLRDLHLLQGFMWGKGAWLHTATRCEMQEKCNFVFHAKPREEFPPRARWWGETTMFPSVFRIHGPCEMEVYRLNMDMPCSLPDVPISVWVLQIQICSLQRLLWFSPEDVGRRKVSQTLGFLLFVSLTAVQRGAVPGKDDLSLKSRWDGSCSSNPQERIISRKEWGWERSRTNPAQTSTKQSLAWTYWAL